MPQASIALLIAAAVIVAAAALLLLELRRVRGRSVDLELAIAELGKRDLVGRHVIVNTRKPDDQSIRGWVRAELDDGTLELAQAFYLEPGGDGAVEAVSVGDVRVPGSSVAWVQLDVPAPAPAD